MSPRRTIAGLMLGLAVAGAARGAPPATVVVQPPAVTRAVQWLRANAGGSQVGETALMALAMLKAEVPDSDPALAGALAKLRTRFPSTAYSPERSGGADLYEAAVVALALANHDAEVHRAEIAAVAQYLLNRQNANGSWDYPHRTAGDTSISQYAVLGLWECENAGARVPPEVWDRAAGWYLSVQGAAGSWNYHRDESGPETLSMTAAGCGSLLICQRQLARYGRGQEGRSPLLIPLGPEDHPGRYKRAHTAARIDAAVKRGLAWLGSHYRFGGGADVGQTPYYALYGVERAAALADRETLGRLDWYAQGARFLESTQRPDGSWDAQFGPQCNTAWAVLFLSKATRKTLQRVEVKRLGAGTLLGGRGLPSDLSSLTVAGGRVVARPMNGAIEGMLAVLEDPRAESADSALAGLVARYRAEGPPALRPHRDRFLRLLKDPDPGVRRVAAWALGRIGDLDVVPALAAALVRPDEAESVVGELAGSLDLLARKVEGFGPAPPSSPEQREQSASRWLEWYRAIRPAGNGPGADLDLLDLPAAASRRGSP